MRPDRYYMRDPRLVAVGTRQRFLFVDGDRRAGFDGVEAAPMSHVLQQLVHPTRGRDLFAGAIGAAAADAPAARAVVEQLAADGHVLEATEAEALAAARARVLTDNQGYHFQPGEPRCDTLVVALTGTVISGLMAPYLFSLAFSRFHRTLELVCTDAATSFVQPELFEYYGVRTWTDAFERRPGATVPHIVLARSADLLAVLPATAACIARLAGGACSDLLSLVAAATKAPIVVGPTMNTAMWDNPAVRRNVDQLRADGVYVIEPTFFYEAAELIHGADPLVGMVGVFWAGPAGLMATLAAVLDDHARSELA